MPVRTATRRGNAVRCLLEPLEDRFLLSATPISNLGGDATLDHAQSLGALATPLTVVGAIHDTATHPAQVDWYTFTLAQPATVALKAAAPQGQTAPVVSLYNNDPNDYADQYDPLGNRLVAQASADASGVTSLSQPLDAGTYYVAVSGAGNLYFNPYIADSGYPGQDCTYQLGLSETPLALGTGPAVIASTPAANAQLTESPLVLRLSLDQPQPGDTLDPSTILPGQNVALFYSPTPFSLTNPGTPVALNPNVANNGVNYSASVNELQLTPQVALAPGYYRVFLAGNTNGSQPALTDLNNNPLGADASHPHGQDFVETFQVVGIDGNVGANAASDDTAATARPLGNITGVNVVQVPGAIGDDPAYNPNSPNPALESPGNQVDLYQFQVTGPGRHQMTAEVFAGRIGSPLDAGMSLFSVDPSTGLLDLVAANDNSDNTTPLSNNAYSQPLSSDPVLYAGLTDGTYYLAVSSAGNVPDPTEAAFVGQNGIFDPNQAYSGLDGYSTGDYVLNVQVGAGSTTPPQVTQVSLTQGAVLNGPPGLFTVQFSEPVNLAQLASLAAIDSPQITLAGVYIQGANGPQQVRLASYDPTTYTATFLPLSPVPPGPAQLHLVGSGMFGVTDLADNPLVGNSPSGDYVVDFTVAGPPRGTNGNPLLWQATPSGDTQQAPQVLGILFPSELQSRVQLQRTTPTTGTDYYQFQVLQDRLYTITFISSQLPIHTPLGLVDASGNPVVGQTAYSSGSSVTTITLVPGTYTLSVPDVTTSEYQYTVNLGLVGSAESVPPPLTAGPSPAIRVVYVDATPATGSGAVATTLPAPGAATGDPASPAVSAPVSAPVSTESASDTLVLVPVSELVRPTEGLANGTTTTMAALLILTQSLDGGSLLTVPTVNGPVTVEPVALETGLVQANPLGNQLLPRIAGSDDPQVSDKVPEAPGTVASAQPVSTGDHTEGPTGTPAAVAARPSSPGEELLMADLANGPVDSLFQLNPVAFRDALSALGLSNLTSGEGGQVLPWGDAEAVQNWTNVAARVSACITLGVAAVYFHSLRLPRQKPKDDILCLFS